MILFRPVGLEELALIYDSHMRGFPPRLPDQPIFYPVTTEAYARQIAKDWNTKSGSFAGLVTRFSIEDAYVSKFPRRVVGSREHEELWVPAEDLSEFNHRIEPPIEVVAAYFGDVYRGHVPEKFGFKSKDAKAQLVMLGQALSYSGFDLVCEIAANHSSIFLNYFFWQQHDFTEHGIDRSARDALLLKLKRVWRMGSHESIPLGVE
ncbi:MAG: hypothetical protein NVS3B20_01760 [Polyangiales bacterium]